MDSKEQSIKDPEYININARGIVIRAPINIMEKSPIMKEWIDSWRTTNKTTEYYINRQSKDIHNLIDYLSGFCYERSMRLSEILDELGLNPVNCKEEIKEIMDKIINTKENHLYMADYKIDKSMVSRHLIDPIGNELVDNNTHVYDSWNLWEDTRYYIIRCYKSYNYLKGLIDAGIENKTIIFDSDTDDDGVDYVAKLIRMVGARSKYVYRENEDNNEGWKYIKLSDTYPEKFVKIYN
jgi:hypothetical protein